MEQNALAFRRPSQQLREGWWYDKVKMWYRFAAPPEVDTTNSFAIQDRARRGRLSSLILLVLLVTIISFIPIGIGSINPLLLPIILSLFVVWAIAVLLNRSGKVATAGVLCIATINVALLLNLVTAPHNILTTKGILSYDLLVFSELIAVSVLPPVSVFAVAVINSLCIVTDMILQPHSPELERLISASTYTLLIRPLALQAMVAVVTFLWVSSAMRALERADRAEEIARLQRTIADQKQDLEFGIQQIQMTLVTAANGNFSIRTPLAQENVLWQVAASLNTLLARLQRSNQSEQELQRMQAEVVRLVSMVREAQVWRKPIRVTPTGTMLDPLLKELIGRYIVGSSSSGD
jgi:hypothetical protein